ncbi:DNA-directed RNA polymerase subunit alpha C-terminal domain-containing protein (plasmid) [Acinetobacter radioresistens]|uniref:DNA-directed RNA polymerase subunit alpha C-terminal domain-containing protein n=1 Tax=Acinetobacter radioresistens TaxID=40216 RepID=UPI0032B5EFA0
MSESLKKKQICEIKELSTRAKNALIGANILSVDDLLKMTSYDVESIPYMGKASMAQIRNYLTSRGLELDEGGHKYQNQKNRIIDDIQKWAPRLSIKDLQEIKGILDGYIPSRK